VGASAALEQLTKSFRVAKHSVENLGTGGSRLAGRYGGHERQATTSIRTRPVAEFLHVAVLELVGDATKEWARADRYR